MEYYDVQWKSYLPYALYRRRKTQRWSQEQLAEAVEVDVKTVGRWERGEAFPYKKYCSTLQRLFFTKEPQIKRTATLRISLGFELFDDSPVCEGCIKFALCYIEVSLPPSCTEDDFNLFNFNWGLPSRHALRIQMTTEKPDLPYAIL
jgi:transcriptional regulator with XRE-family HTH domain